MHTTPTQIRQFDMDDSDAVRAMFHQWSDQSTYERFFCMSPRLADDYVDLLADPQRTLFAVIAITETGDVVGVGSTHPVAPDQAEFGLAVDDDDRGHGIGTRLLAALLQNAHRQRVTRLVAYVQPVNHRMLQVIVDELPDATRELHDGMVTVKVPVDAAIRHQPTHIAQEVRS